MTFENKKEHKITLWKVLKWYWVLIPIVYSFYVILPIFGQGTSADVDNSPYFVIAFLLINFGLAGILSYTPPNEISREGAAKHILGLAIAQQVFAQNTIGALLTLVTWYKLPEKPMVNRSRTVKSNKEYLTTKTLYTLMAIILIITVVLILVQNLIF